MSDGPTDFLYPFLERSGDGAAELDTLLDEVTRSTRDKAAETIELRSRIDTGAVMACAAAIRSRLEAGATLIVFGNGGSATDAQDFAFDLRERGLRAVALVDDVATITAIGNDVGFEQVFARQIEALCGAGDIAVAISTSGASANIVRAIELARSRGLLTCLLSGYGGGSLAGSPLVDHLLAIDGEYVPRIQEAQATVYHLLVDEIGGASG